MFLESSLCFCCGNCYWTVYASEIIPINVFFYTSDKEIHEGNCHKSRHSTQSPNLLLLNWVIFLAIENSIVAWSVGKAEQDCDIANEIITFALDNYYEEVHTNENILTLRIVAW